MIRSLLFSFLLMSSSAFADYILLVPQKPGGGTSVWAEIVAGEMRKYLDEDIIIKHMPGARDIPGFNKFHNKYQYDDKVIMVSHGGNGVSFLQEDVEYNYKDYDSIGLMNLNIIAGKLKDDDMNPIKFAAGSGMVPEGMAITMLECGNMSLEDHIKCFKEKVVWVKGMSGGERRLAFKRGELNGTRENPAAYKKHVEVNPNAEIWFHHGILQRDGSHADDPNYRGFQFEKLFEERWGEQPNSDLYYAYKLVKSFRDGLQKALWVRSGNPNAEVLREALRKVSTNEESRAAIRKKVGDYDWIIGEDANRHRDMLYRFIQRDTLDILVEFNTKAFGLASVFKEDLVK